MGSMQIQTIPKTWKDMVQSAVRRCTTKELYEEAEEKSTLGYMYHVLQKGAHPVISHIDNPREVTRCSIKVRLLTGTYPLQKFCHKTNKADSGMCLLCKVETEDTEHFLERCEIYEDIRCIYMKSICSRIPEEIPLTNCLLESRAILSYHPKANIAEIEKITRNYIYALHIRRNERLQVLRNANSS